VKGTKKVVLATGVEGGDLLGGKKEWGVLYERVWLPAWLGEKRKTTSFLKKRTTGTFPKSRKEVNEDRV